jgi:hypothetical protein
MTPKQFAKKYLINPKWPKSKNSTWDVKGTLKNHSNKEYKFDLKPLKPVGKNEQGKKGSFKTKAEKIVYDYNNKLIIVDVEELHLYLLNNKLDRVYLDHLLEKLEWTILIIKS